MKMQTPRLVPSHLPIRLVIYARSTTTDPTGKIFDEIRIHHVTARGDGTFKIEVNIYYVNVTHNDYVTKFILYAPIEHINPGVIAVKNNSPTVGQLVRELPKIDLWGMQAVILGMINPARLIPSVNPDPRMPQIYITPIVLELYNTGYIDLKKMGPNSDILRFIGINYFTI